MAGPRSLTYIAHPIARRALGKKHADLGLLLDHWDDIVGADLARYAVPDRIAKGRQAGSTQRGATLHIRVTPGASAHLQHDSPRLIERLNAVLGPGAIDSVRLSQSGLGMGSNRQRRPRPLPAAEAAELNDLLVSVKDPALRAALSALGEGVYRHNPEVRPEARQKPDGKGITDQHIHRDHTIS